MGFLHNFARNESGASSSEYALLLLVALTGLALSSFILGKAIGESVVHTASLFRPVEVAASAASASDSRGVQGPGSGLIAADSSAEGAAGVPGCGKGADKEACKGHAKAKNAN